MIAHLHGTIGKLQPGELTVDVQGVGYKVFVPITVWDGVIEGQGATIFTSSYVREDRFDLYGFLDRSMKTLFECLINLQGVGPRMGLELCSVPQALILKAILEDDATLLMSVKGIGKKTAEKLLVELKSLMERNPHLFTNADGGADFGAEGDRDALAALTQLGFSTGDAMKALKELPSELKTTEDRITAALRSL